jgi:hypothetical protein
MDCNPQYHFQSNPFFAEARFPKSAPLYIDIGDLLCSMKRYEEAFPHRKRDMDGAAGL